jgi:hypothetical protein
MAETTRNLQENFGVTAEQAAYRESEIRRHVGETWVEGYEDLIPATMAVKTSLHANHLPEDLHGIRTAIDKAVI